MTERFDAYCRRKESAAISATIPGYTTVREDVAEPAVSFGNEWSRTKFDGEFHRSAAVAASGLPVISLVFVQSRDGNTVAPNPGMLGGGATDLHLIYEGLSRVGADAVCAGSATARARNLVFSVWHPELVALRRALGQPRHPAQVVVTGRGDLPFDEALMFAEPALRVFVITSAGAASRVHDRLRGRPWVEVIDAGDPISLTRAMRQLRTHGVEVVSAVGGRRTATALLREGLVADVYLTTSPLDAGEPGTPFYEGPPLSLRHVVSKAGKEIEEGVRFEHLIVR